MHMSLKVRLEGIRDWFKIRLHGDRCEVCGRLFVLHPPMRWTGCWDVTLPIQITEQGLRAIGIEPRRVVLSEKSDVICPWHGRFLSPDTGCPSCTFLVEALERSPLRQTA